MLVLLTIISCILITWRKVKKVAKQQKKKDKKWKL